MASLPSERAFRQLVLGAASVLAAGACSSACKPKELGVGSGVASDSGPGDGAVEASIEGVDAAPSASSAASPKGPPPRWAPLLDAGAGSLPVCKLVAEALPLPFNGPAVLRLARHAGVAGETPELVTNEGGTAHVVMPTMRPLGGLRLEPGSPPAKNVLPACAAAGDAVFCPDVDGAIRKGNVVVAQSRPGTPIAAALLGTRPLLAYLAERETSEGRTREAHALVEGAEDVRLSEAGSGATFVDLASRGDEVLALTIDARIALTPAHARVVTFANGKLQLGTDAVIFVGGSGERHNAGALATSRDGLAFALIPVANDAENFGMASITIGNPPRDQEDVRWSLYPNGLDPAPVAATHGRAAMHVARVRPKGSEPDSWRVLEVGVLERGGEFRPVCLAAEAAFIKELAMQPDGADGLWLFWREPRGVRLERRLVTLPR